jgi:hypothetical protein
MQTLESFLSLLFLLSILSIFYLSVGSASENSTDSSLYKFLILKDTYRSLSLRGNFQDFSSSEYFVSKLDSEFEKIGNLTSKCYFLEGIKMTNCRGGNFDHQKIVSSEIVLVEDNYPKRVVLSISN